MSRDPDDLHSRVSVGVSDRLFYALLGAVAFWLLLVLGGCAWVYHASIHSSDGNVTGDFMIGEPHEKTTFTNTECCEDPERLDVQSR